MTPSTSPGTGVEPGDVSPQPSPLPEPDLILRGRAAIRSLLSLATDRAAAETKVESTRITRESAAEAEYQKAHQAVLDKHQRLEREANAEDERRRRAVTDTAMAGEARARAEFAAASRQITADFDGARERARAEFVRRKAEADAEFQSGQRKAAEAHGRRMQPLVDASVISDAFRSRLSSVASDYGKFGLIEMTPAPSRETYSRHEDPTDELLSRLGRMEAPLKLLEDLLIPRSLKGAREAWVYLVMAGLALTFGIWLQLDFSLLVVLAVAGAGLGLVVRLWLAQLAREQLQRLHVPLTQSLADADGLRAYCVAQATIAHDEAKRQVFKSHEDELKRIKDEHAQAISAAESNRDERLRRINEIEASARTNIQTVQAREMRDAIEAHDRRIPELRLQVETNLRKLSDGYKALKEEIRNRHDSSWARLVTRWREGIGRLTGELAEIQAAVDAFGPDWDSPAWRAWSMPVRLPPALRLGEVRFELAGLPGGVPRDSRLREGLPSSFRIPALRPFPAGANLLIEAPPEGRGAALSVLQASMFRLLTSLPPGMVRFTLVDPVGMGRTFGAFMHLADFDPVLVGGQVWTDTRQIEDRLGELVTHMETVTQKYLRNDYATIEEYNAVAGEVAEPYRALVLADFPTQFDEKALRRLLAIATGGVSCGVLVLIAADPTRPMPAEFRLDDLRPSFGRIAWDGKALAWEDPDFGAHPLSLDAPPPVELANRLIQRIGAAARDARRVEVPFEFIAPEPRDWWTLDSRSGIDVPLGKSGATRRQNLALGKGTSQHVLVAGRTGSGKSTLMHALITNLALHYSPDQIELHLIDFKKGVEFKVYASYALPHAAVVAIESEREFGISVLQRLDVEMRLRADRFRDAGVPDLAGYRNLTGVPPLPRILLIVDEFQEFFVEDDKLAQEAASLLDRLVRQGRAFGLHVLLGSQSLGGAFTLARSTLGQMGVRIALQCSDADAHLILSEDNTAATLLSRPGEAIYNDANGAPEGNSFFQVVWLPDDRREDYLARIRALADERLPGVVRSPIVFEGDAPARLETNPAIRDRLASPDWPESPRSALGWLGDPVAIKEPTSALFRRLASNHLLIMGQDEENALGAMAAVLLSLAVQYPPAPADNTRKGACFFVLDGTPEDNPLAGTLARIAGELPHRAKVGAWRDTTELIGQVAGELQRRQTGGEDGPEVFLFILDLPRFRELRRRDDDFGFSRGEEVTSPHDQLSAIVRDGPGFGIHVVIWCDTLNNLNRHFTHQQLREFGMRVLFQMSQADSSHLLDSPAGSKLGPNRALFYSEEQNRVEKFRPYAMPPRPWWDETLRALRQRSGRIDPPD